MKRIISFILCICMIISVCPVFASDITNPWIQTFSGYDGTELPTGFFMGADEAGIALYGTAGIYGKAADDVAFTHEVLKDATDSNLGYSEYPQWNMNDSIGNVNFEDGDIFCWGYEFAMDSYYGTKDIRLDVQNQDNTRKHLSFVSMLNNQNGKITCMGQTVANSIPLDTWVSLDFVLRPNVNTLDVYYNGNKVINAYDLTSAIGESTLKMNFYRMFLVAAKTDGSYVNAHNYIDNFYAKIVKEEPVIAPVTAVSESSKITVFEDLKKISADDSLSVDDFLASLTVSEGATVTLEDTEKNVQSGSVSAGYLRIGTTDGRYAYYEVSTYSPSKLTYNDFDSLAGKSIANNETVEGITVYTSQADGAEGVVEDLDNVLKIYPATSARKLNMTAADTGDTFAIAFDFKTDSLEGGTAGLTLKYENEAGSTSNYNDIITFKDDGAILFSYSTVGEYEANQWYHITIFADKATKKARVYLDGELLVENTWSPLNSFTRIVDAILCNNATAESGKNVYYDNLCIMPINSLDAVDVAPMNIKTEVENKNLADKNFISGYGAMTVGEFKNILSTPEKSVVTAYLNGKECEDTAYLTDGMLVKVVAEDTRHKKVYYIEEDMRKSAAITVDSKKVNQLYAGAAAGVFSGYVETPVQVYMVIEETKDGEVVQSESGTVTVSGEFEKTIALDTAVKDEEGVSITFSVYDNETDKNLVLPQKVISYSETLEYSTEIMGVYGGRDAIYTITMDDGYATSMNNYFKPWFEKYDLRGSSLSICTWMTSPFLETAQQMVLDGRLDIMSHSYTHPGTLAELEANADKEVYGSQEYLRDLFPGADVLSYGPGSGIMSDSVMAKVKDAYYANRGGSRGYNELDITGDDWMYINVQGVLGGSGTTWKSSTNTYDGETAASMNKWIDNAVANNQWLVEMWHSVCWPESEGSTNYASDGGYRPIPIDISEEHLAYASKLQSEGKLWVAKFDDAVKYLYERNNAVLDDVATRTSRNISLTVDLDKALFNHPLTLKSQVPATWNYVKITQGDITTYKEVQNDESGSYVIYDALVNYSGISLEAVDEPGENEVVESFKINVPENLNQNILEGEKFETVEFKVTGDVDFDKVVWYVDGVESGAGESFKFAPAEDGERVICARYAGCYTQNRRVKTSTTIPPKGVQITNLKYRGASVTVAENTQTFDSNGTLKFMWGDMTNEKMSFQHGWFANIKNIPEALADAKFMTTGSDFNVEADGNYLEFTVDRDAIIVGMYEGDAPLTTLASDGWTICSASSNSDIYDKYKYMRSDKNTYFTYMFYKEVDRGDVAIPYAGAYGWAHGGGFAVIENKTGAPISVITNGGSITASIDGAVAEDWGNTKTDYVDVGSDVVLTAACEDENMTFMYWKSSDGIILSETEELSFKMGSGLSVSAVYADKSMGSFVTFKNANGRVLAAGQMSSQIEVPENPYIAGYEFAGWYVGGEKQSISAGEVVSGYESDVVFAAGYKTEKAKYSVTVVNANEQGGEYVYNSKVTVTPVEKDGETFAYWTKDGAVVSYEESYTFYVNASVEVKAVYSENVEAENILVMSEPTVIGTDKIGFYSERRIKEGFTVIESGILIHSAAGVSLDGYTHKAVTSSLSNNGQFTVRKANVSEGEKWYAAAYVIYTDGENVYTIYSNEVSKEM